MQTILSDSSSSDSQRSDSSSSSSGGGDHLSPLTRASFHKGLKKLEAKIDKILPLVKEEDLEESAVKLLPAKQEDSVSLNVLENADATSETSSSFKWIVLILSALMVSGWTLLDPTILFFLPHIFPWLSTVSFLSAITFSVAFSFATTFLFGLALLKVTELIVGMYQTPTVGLEERASPFIIPPQIPVEMNTPSKSTKEQIKVSGIGIRENQSVIIPQDLSSRFNKMNSQEPEKPTSSLSPDLSLNKSESASSELHAFSCTKQSRADQFLGTVQDPSSDFNKVPQEQPLKKLENSTAYPDKKSEPIQTQPSSTKEHINKVGELKANQSLSTTKVLNKVLQEQPLKKLEKSTAYPDKKSEPIQTQPSSTKAHIKVDELKANQLSSTTKVLNRVPQEQKSALSFDPSLKQVVDIQVERKAPSSTIKTSDAPRQSHQQSPMNTNRSFHNIEKMSLKYIPLTESISFVPKEDKEEKKMDFSNNKNSFYQQQEQQAAVDRLISDYHLKRAQNDSAHNSANNLF